MRGVELQQVLENVATAARAVDTRSYEECRLEILLSELVPTVSSVVQETLAALQRVSEHYDADSEVPVAEPYQANAASGESSAAGDGDFLRHVDGRVAEQFGGSEVADFAYMARTELERRRESLRVASAGAETWRVIVEADRCLRNVIKAATAVELALCQAENLDPVLGFLTEVSRSLIIRRLYGRFRSVVHDAGEPSGAELQPRLRSVAVGIAQLTGHDLYRDLRMSDRVALRDLQRRLISWLTGNDEFSELAGQRLWQDCAGVADLLAAINQRQELREHDAALVRSLCQDMAGQGGDRAVPIEQPVVDQATTLLGLDPQLDALLAQQEKASRGAWKDVLVGLASRLM